MSCNRTIKDGSDSKTESRLTVYFFSELSNKRGMPHHDKYHLAGRVPGYIEEFVPSEGKAVIVANRRWNDMLKVIENLRFYAEQRAAILVRAKLESCQTDDLEFEK